MEEENKIEKLGPGIWYLIHKESLFCKSKEAYIDFIYRLAENFPCSYCKTHFQKYLSENPPESFVGFQDGLFIWSWKFHNSVNKRLKKPIIEYETAINIYLKDDCNYCMKLDSSEKQRKLELLLPVEMIKKKKQKIKFNLRNL